MDQDSPRFAPGREIAVKIWTLTTIAVLAVCIALPCQAQPAPAAPQPFGPAEKRAVVEKAGELLTADYIFPDRAAGAKAKIDAALAAGDYDSITTTDAFAQKLTADLQSVTHDKHMRVSPPEELSGPHPVAGAAAPPRMYAGF